MFEKDCKRKFGIFNSILVDPIPLDLSVKPQGHIMYLNTLGRPIVVLNSLKAAFELLDRRANIYSDRPRRIVANKILCGGLFISSMPYGDGLVRSFL
jgi:hypothetical protein